MRAKSSGDANDNRGNHIFDGEEVVGEGVTEKGAPEHETGFPS